MSRRARQKHSEAIYHIICRSITEVTLFREDGDKVHYLNLLKRYIDKYKCSVYAYCLMDNHLHIHFDPKGFDISKLMHCLNTAYVQYYNRKYQRRGPLFQDRFVSRILDTDRYNLAVSAYIHNNPKDIPSYNGREEYYPFSSYGIFLGLRNDSFDIVNVDFIAGLCGMDSKSKDFSRKYYDFVSNQNSEEDYQSIENDISLKTENEYVNSRSVLLRELAPDKVVSFISKKLSIYDKYSKAIKGNRKFMEYRSICAYVLRVFCGLNYKDICSIMNNITISGCSRLCDVGCNIFNKNYSAYSSLYEELTEYVAA